MTDCFATADIAIIGAGMAGASLAAEIGGGAKMVLIEREAQPGYHSTGRSAAFWSETYGGPLVQPLTSASHAYLADNGFLTRIGAIHLEGRDGAAAIEALVRDYGQAVRLDRLTAEDVAARIPGLRGGQGGGLAEPSCSAIDVAGLHAHYLARARKAGAEILTDYDVLGLKRAGQEWQISTSRGTIVARTLVNAAGAWAGGVAAMAGAQSITITPMRRTMVQLEVYPPVPSDMPLVMDAAEAFYLKPEAGGRIWLSPHDESPTEACDAAPEEIDIATAIDRLEQVVTWRIVRRERAWAGLRSFAPDRVPVYGFDSDAPDFFWFAGQGGFGIQTAPAAAMIGAALLMGRSLPEAVRHIIPDPYGPGRF